MYVYMYIIVFKVIKIIFPRLFQDKKISFSLFFIHHKYRYTCFIHKFLLLSLNYLDHSIVGYYRSYDSIDFCFLQIPFHHVQSWF